ncbi:MAG: Pvc16 family protein, partial [Nostocoides sp.]
MSLFSPGPPVIAGVDEVLRVLTTEAMKGLGSPVGVSVGPLDRPVDGARLNWFLYRIEPSTAYVNMEPPVSGWRTRRGHPPLALTLRYLLS